MNAKEWVYRCIYDCHYLMSKYTNEIVSISPLIGQIFGTYNGDIIKWSEQNNISNEDRNVIITYLFRKGIIDEIKEV